jgi:hypothetical protein
MRTWTPLAGPPLPTSAFNPFQGGYVVSCWLNPFSGELLAITTSGVFNAEQFWTSSDVGQRWTQIKDPPFPFAVYDILVQQPFAGQPWRICGADPANWYINGQHNTHIHDVACTPDGGATWVTSHLDLSDAVLGTPDYALDAIADDGSVLALLPAGLARFTPGSSRLDLLGPIPSTIAQQGTVPYAGVLVYAAGQGVGTFWTEPTGANTGGPPGPVFTATYA